MSKKKFKKHITPSSKKTPQKIKPIPTDRVVEAPVEQSDEEFEREIAYMKAKIEMIKKRKAEEQELDKKIKAPPVEKDMAKIIIQKAKDIALQVAKYKHVSGDCALPQFISTVCFRDNKIGVKFEGYNRGYWEDIVELEMDDLFEPTNSVIEKYRLAHEKYQQEKQKSLEEAEKLKKEEEYQAYLKMKKKFEQ